MVCEKLFNVCYVKFMFVFLNVLVVGVFNFMVASVVLRAIFSFMSINFGEKLFDVCLYVLVL